MWLLISTKNQDEKFELLVDEDYVVGRKDCSILIQNDPSISRKHATLRVSHHEVNLTQPQRPPILTVKDESRFGTLVRGEKVKPQEQRILKNGDLVKFGTVNSIFQAVYEPFLVTTSCLDAAAKKQTKKLVAHLGGHVVSEWRKECQLLVMSSISVTVKVICALVSQKPVITSQYLTDLVKSIQAKTKRPSPDKYIPILAESQLDSTKVSFNPDARRKSLFQGKVFVFLSQKQFNKLNLAIELAGGTPILMEEGSDDNEDDILLAKTTCVMNCDASDTSHNLTKNAQEWIGHVMKLLKRHGRRPIPDAELGFAVLYCSTDTYCNPMADPGSSGDRLHVPSQSLSQAPLETDVLAHDTEPEPRRSSVGTSCGPSVVPASDSESNPEDQDHIRKSKSNTTTGPVSLKQTVKTEVSSQNSGCPAPERRNDRSINGDTKGADTAAKNSTSAKVLGRKRPRESEDDDAAPSDVPPPKKNPFSFTRREEPETLDRIKQEIVTPAKHKGKHDVINVDEEERSPTREKMTNKPNSGPQKVPKEEPSDDLFDFGARKSRKSQRKQSPNPDPGLDEEEDLFDFGARKNRKSQKTRSPSPKPKRGALSPKPKRELSDDEENPFEFGVRRSQRRKSKSPSPKPDFRGKPKPNTSPGRDIETRSRSSRSPSPSAPRINSDDENVSSPASKGPAKKGKGVGKNTATNAEPYAEVVSENVKGARVKSEAGDRMEENGATPILPEHISDGNVPSGFLTCVKPIQDQLCDINMDYVKEENLPSNCVQTEFKSLLVRKPKVAKPAPTEKDTAMWKGKPVKNFKKFRKSEYAGMAGLPQIIGRTDLMVHANKSGREVESWFADEMQAESQQNEIDRMAQELFDYVLPKKRKGTRR